MTFKTFLYRFNMFVPKNIFNARNKANIFIMTYIIKLLSITRKKALIDNINKTPFGEYEKTYKGVNTNYNYIIFFISLLSKFSMFIIFNFPDA